jgi:hypothetical protein
MVPEASEYVQTGVARVASNSLLSEEKNSMAVYSISFNGKAAQSLHCSGVGRLCHTEHFPFSVEGGRLMKICWQPSAICEQSAICFHSILPGGALYIRNRVMEHSNNALSFWFVRPRLQLPSVGERNTLWTIR